MRSVLKIILFMIWGGDISNYKGQRNNFVGGIGHQDDADKACGRIEVIFKTFFKAELVYTTDASTNRYTEQFLYCYELSSMTTPRAWKLVTDVL
jgi:hypothetical protein